MIRENCSLIGVITKTHGIAGQVMIRLNGDFADDIEPGEPVFVEVDENLVPFFIEEAEVFPDRAILRLEFISSPQEAKKFTGKNVYLDNSLISGRDEFSPENGEFFIGYSFRDITSGKEGIIKDFTDNLMNPLFLVSSGKSEFLLPVHEDFILKVDHKKKHMDLKLPEGLAEI
jgi:16S rRNA processing protein RimM